MIHTRWFEIDFAMAAYTVVWLLCVVLALMHLWFKREAYATAYRGYAAFLLAPWKVITFVIATIGITVVAPYTGDPTWDYIDAPMMAVLTYLTAPWVMGLLYRARATPLAHLLVAGALWMLAASWCYDGYQLLLHGFYPITWFFNIIASSVLYISAGLMWNLDMRPGRGATFAFLEPEWLVPPAPGTNAKVLLWASPFMALAAGSIIYFLV
jgi:hypothetical protein